MGRKIAISAACIDMKKNTKVQTNVYETVPWRTKQHGEVIQVESVTAC